jgi:hypothetical protein
MMYAASVLVITFFGTLNFLALGLIGIYIWRTFENTKARPNYILLTRGVYDKDQKGASHQ